MLQLAAPLFWPGASPGVSHATKSWKELLRAVTQRGAIVTEYSARDNCAGCRNTHCVAPR